MDSYSNVNGTIFDIQRYSVHDGPGIRTIAFLKGCPLRCRWCCNPESYTIEPQTMMVLGKEVETGRRVTVEELLAELLKDMVYYRRSGGGITLSGGEPLFQPEFALNILKACKEKWIHTAIETSGCADYAVYEALFPFLDLLMVDVKHMSSAKHKDFTGQPNELILENVKRFARDAGVKMVVRVPVIPTFNDTAEEITQIASFVATLPGVREIHLLPYHRLGEEKYRGLNQPYQLSGIEPMPNDKMSTLLEVATLASGLKCQIGG